MEKRRIPLGAGQPTDNGEPVAWARAMEALRDALLAARVTDHRELASVVT